MSKTKSQNKPQADSVGSVFDPPRDKYARRAVEILAKVGLDKGIERAVLILVNAGIETYESCEGGPGHSYPEPAIRFYGERAEGFRALAIALQHALPVSFIRRIWSINDGEPIGPDWEIVFSRKMK